MPFHFVACGAVITATWCFAMSGLVSVRAVVVAVAHCCLSYTAQLHGQRASWKANSFSASQRTARLVKYSKICYNVHDHPRPLFCYYSGIILICGRFNRQAPWPPLGHTHHSMPGFEVTMAWSWPLLHQKVRSFISNPPHVSALCIMTTVSLPDICVRQWVKWRKTYGIAPSGFIFQRKISITVDEVINLDISSQCLVP
jgi:hypothetical protein